MRPSSFDGMLHLQQISTFSGFYSGQKSGQKSNRIADSRQLEGFFDQSGVFDSPRLHWFQFQKTRKIKSRMILRVFPCPEHAHALVYVCYRLIHEVSPGQRSIPGPSAEKMSIGRSMARRSAANALLASGGS